LAEEKPFVWSPLLLLLDCIQTVPAVDNGYNYHNNDDDDDEDDENKMMVPMIMMTMMTTTMRTTTKMKMVTMTMVTVIRMNGYNDDIKDDDDVKVLQ
jgi:hypothetical protein